MNQKMKKMVLHVINQDNVEIYSKDPANPDICMYAFALFGDVGNRFQIDIVEVDEDNVKSSVS